MAIFFKSKFENRLGTSFINDYFGINLYDFLFEKVFKIDSKFFLKLESYSNIKGDEKILDIGSGTSSFAIYLKKKYKDLEIESVDGSSKMLEIAEKKIKKNRVEISTQEGLAENLPFEDNTFDIIYSVFLFSYIPETIKPFALKELNRVLKKDGKLVVVDITEQNGLKRVWNSLKYIPNQFFLNEGLSGKYVRLLNNANFRDIVFNPIIDKFIDISIILSYKK